MKHLFLVNPAAGKRGSTEALLRRVEEAFSPLGLEHEVVLTSSAGDAEQLARRAACSGGPVRIYACGGGPSTKWSMARLATPTRPSPMCRRGPAMTF